MILYQIGSKDELREILKELLTDLLSEATKPADLTELLTRKEAAEFLKISLPTLGQYTKEGVIKGRKCGNKVLYRKDELLNSGKIIQSLKYKKRYE